MSTMPEEPSCLSTCHFDVEKYDKRNVDERTYEDNVDEKTYEDVLSDVAGMNLETFYKKAWGTGANDVEAPALGNAGPKTPHFVVDVADMDIEVEPYFVKAWGTGANDVEAPALGNTGPKSPSFVADLAAKDSETFLERAWGTVANRVGAPALGNTGPRSQHPRLLKERLKDPSGMEINAYKVVVKL